MLFRVINCICKQAKLPLATLVQLPSLFAHAIIPQKHGYVCTLCAMCFTDLSLAHIHSIYISRISTYRLASLVHKLPIQTAKLNVLRKT